eukprot:3389485-Pyramimonas_sp.AAC.1
MSPPFIPPSAAARPRLLSLRQRACVLGKSAVGYVKQAFSHTRPSAHIILQDSITASICP